MKKISFINFLSGVTDRFLPALFWTLLIFGFDTPCIAIITLIAAAIHELGHLTALILVNVPCRMPEGRLMGLKLKIEKCGYKEHIFILALGPFFNLAAALISLPLIKNTEYFSLIAIVNFATALSNLLPVDGYDGYEIIKGIMSLNEINTKPLEILSFAISITLTFVSLYMIGRFGVGYWIFGVYFTYLLKKIHSLNQKVPSKQIKCHFDF